MKTYIYPLVIFALASLVSCSHRDNNPFWGDGTELFDIQDVFSDERFPNIIVATDGTVIATWGSEHYRIRRSEDGGNTWGPEISIAQPGFHGGGVTVDENTGDILLFVEAGHPPAPFTIYRSKDHGKTWEKDDFEIFPDSKGNIPSMHMNERGITLKHGNHAGRLIRPSRVYAGGNEEEYWDYHYTNAIYSDDGGKTWYSSEPFPAYGTGEAAIEELQDGTLYYNSRRHRSTDGLNPRMRHIAWSYDSGHTWEDLSVSDVLPDGPQGHDYGLMAGLVRLPVDGHDILVYSNIDSPGHRWQRERGTVWVSFDGGKTWPISRLVDEGGFAYSSLVAGRAGTPGEGWIYLMYEFIEDGRYAGAKVARFNLPWITQGRDWKEFIN
jgi:sialidase-1